MKSLTLKNKINLGAIIAFLVMVILHLISQMVNVPGIKLYNIFFAVAGVVYIVYVLFREYAKRNKYTVFISYVILLVLLILIILIFNELATSTQLSSILFIISLISTGIALLLGVVALFHDLEWYKKNVRIYAHISASIGVILSVINLLVNYTWKISEGNRIIIIICVAMFNVMIEALIRSFKINKLAFFADNYLITGITSLVFSFIILGGF